MKRWRRKFVNLDRYANLLVLLLWNHRFINEKSLIGRLLCSLFHVLFHKFSFTLFWRRHKFIKLQYFVLFSTSLLFFLWEVEDGNSVFKYYKDIFDFFFQKFINLSSKPPHNIRLVFLCCQKLSKSFCNTFNFFSLRWFILQYNSLLIVFKFLIWNVHSVVRTNSHWAMFNRNFLVKSK